MVSAWKNTYDIVVMYVTRLPQDSTNHLTETVTQVSVWCPTSLPAVSCQYYHRVSSSIIDVSPMLDSIFTTKSFEDYVFPMVRWVSVPRGRYTHSTERPKRSPNCALKSHALLNWGKSGARVNIAAWTSFCEDRLLGEGGNYKRRATAGAPVATIIEIIIEHLRIISYIFHYHRETITDHYHRRTNYLHYHRGTIIDDYHRRTN